MALILVISQFAVFHFNKQVNAKKKLTHHKSSNFTSLTSEDSFKICNLMNFFVINILGFMLWYSKNLQTKFLLT